MSGGLRSVIAGVLGRFSSTAGAPPSADIPETDWYRFSELPVEQNRNLSAINFNDRALTVSERDSYLPVQQNRPRNGVNSS